MKIRGEVEVFAVMPTGESCLISKGANLLVDGASEVIADIMTTPSSIGGITGASELLDTSNFIVRAVSLGKPAESFECPARGAHYYSSFLSGEYGNFYDTISDGGDEDVDLPQVRVLLSNTGLYGSSIPRLHHLPSYPDPMNTSLELSTTTDYELTTGDINPTSATSNGQTGHNMNMFFGPSSLHHASSVFLGCYAPSDGIEYYLMENIASTSDTYFASASVLGHYNAIGDDPLGVVDKRGFIRGYTHKDTSAAAEWDDLTLSGLMVSGCSTSSSDSVIYTDVFTASEIFVNGPAVAHTFEVSSPDVAFLDLYGGVHQIGLWTIDLKETLNNGGTNPFEFKDANGDSKIIYKLFAKKTFVENLTEVVDRSTGTPANDAGHLNHANLYIRWKITFDTLGWTYGEH